MTWGSWLKPRDASGRESRTLAMVGITVLLMWGRFVLGGLAVSFGPIRYEIAPTSMTDFGVAVAAAVTVWVGREWVRSKTTKGKTDA